MPCYDPRSSDDNNDNRRRIDALTAMLCALCGEIEAQDMQEHFIHEETAPGLPAWWDEHKRLDAARNRPTP